MLKWLVVNIRGHEHDPTTRKEPLKSKCLAFGDLGLQKRIRGLFVDILSFDK